MPLIMWSVQKKSAPSENSWGDL